MRPAVLLLFVCLLLAAQDRPLVRQGQYALWHDPGPVETLDFRYGPGGPEVVPKPPFRFLHEDPSGSSPKVLVRDANDRQWSVKFGPEAKPEAFCVRLAWSLGYYVPPTHLIREGVITGASGLERARKRIDESGRFSDGRFQLRSSTPKFLRTIDWVWDDNPFVGTPELNALKIVMMLVSNWDDKDDRDAASRGSNTGIYEQDGLYLYFINDWGGSMGSWGKLLTRSKWNAGDFERQSAHFVRVGSQGLEWGYSGQHTSLMTRDIRFSDVRWLMIRLGAVSDDQLRAALEASGATDSEVRRFSAALRARIVQLKNAISPAVSPATRTVEGMPAILKIRASRRSASGLRSASN